MCLRPEDRFLHFYELNLELDAEKIAPAWGLKFCPKSLCSTATIDTLMWILVFMQSILILFSSKYIFGTFYESPKVHRCRTRLLHAPVWLDWRRKLFALLLKHHSILILVSLIDNLKPTEILTEKEYWVRTYYLGRAKISIFGKELQIVMFLEIEH